MEIYIIALALLAILAASDLIVGVANDAVNFLNSAIGSKCAPRKTIMLIASLGMVMGVLFSKGMMEVARKGIFNPEFFTFPELMMIFLAVMLTDVMLLDLFNTYGLPTSTTVSIVFELLGASVVLAGIKILTTRESFATLANFINTSNVLGIISGILISVVLAFFFGMLFQFLTRLLFTFDFIKRLRRYGAIWSGAAMSFIIYFILVKGAKGSSIISAEGIKWIQQNTGWILLGCFILSVAVLQALVWLFDVVILKPIVLIGTFALALAFAANDLINFIGVPLAGLNAYNIALTLPHPLTDKMGALASISPSNTIFMLLSGVVMVLTLFFSRKARTVMATEVNLGRQEEGVERFDSTRLSRAVVRMTAALGEQTRKIIPLKVQAWINYRLDESRAPQAEDGDDEPPAFDLVRAAVNLMVSAALISLGTSFKLPLSTTYVTFMVAMGSSFSDRAWGLDSAVYRVTGVLIVIGGWFFTAFMAFFCTGVFVVIIYFFQGFGVIILSLAGIIVVMRSNLSHKKREKETKELEIFQLKKVTDGKYAVVNTFKHTGLLLNATGEIISMGFQGLEKQNRSVLQLGRKKAKQVREWTNILASNIIKTLLLVKRSSQDFSETYALSVGIMQEIAEAQRDIIRRAIHHVGNHHKPPSMLQLDELRSLQDMLQRLLNLSSDAMMNQKFDNFTKIKNLEKEIRDSVKIWNHNQMERILNQTSKTRPSILFYGLTRDHIMIADRVVELMKIFQASFNLNNTGETKLASLKEP